MTDLSSFNIVEFLPNFFRLVFADSRRFVEDFPDIEATRLRWYFTKDEPVIAILVRLP